MPWDRWSLQDRVVCTKKEQFAQFDMMSLRYRLIEVDEVEQMSGCMKRCSYKEYKFVNNNPKPLLMAQVPDNQIAIGLWAVSKYTQFEEEVLFSLK